MFDLMTAIEREYQTPPPADSADTAESQQTRGLKPADELRKAADYSVSGEKSANVRKYPQTLKTYNPLNQNKLSRISANPQNPHHHAATTAQSPDAMLAEIAALLQADPDQLRALLSADDLDDIAQGRNNLDFMLTYFRLMRSNGQLPITAPPAPKRPAPQSAPTAADRAKAWKPAHDAMINHIMACNACYAPRQRYCEQGADLHKAYINDWQSANRAESLTINLRP